MVPKNDAEISLLVNDCFHDLLEEMPDAQNTASVCKLMQSAVVFTRREINEHNFRAVKKCMLAVEKLYDFGNRAVRNAIENVYVYSFANLFGSVGEAVRVRLHSIIPIGLYTIYVSQLKASNFP